jgi:hypothetical protein
VIMSLAIGDLRDDDVLATMRLILDGQDTVDADDLGDMCG